MAGTFFYPPSKRSLISDSTVGASNGILSSSAKRSKLPQKSSSPHTVPPGHVALRLLCHSSRIGGIIGKSGSVIKQLQVETSSKIRIEDSLSGSDDRVIVIIAASSPVKKLRLRNASGAISEYFGEYEVSSAQEAVIRVYERILDVTADTNGVSVAALGGEVVSFRLLVDRAQASFVIGKGGKVVEKIKKESGSKIRVLMGDKLPTGVSEGDEVVEIEGDLLAVKKALLAVSQRIQDCPAADKPKIVDSKSLGSTPLSALPDLHDDILPQRTLVLPHVTSHALGSRPLSFGGDRVSTPETTLQQQSVVFKMLCSADRVGGIIGKGGSIIKALQAETRATIRIEPRVADCDEQLITITSLETPESRHSSAQHALVLTFTKYVESIIEKGQDTGSVKGSSICARLLVPSNQAGCLIGKGGVIISEMRKTTGAGIRIIRDKLPKCASENDEIVEISGEFVNVQDAVHQVAGRLRDNLFASRTPAVAGSEIKTNSSSLYGMSPYERLIDPVSVGLHQSIGTPQMLNRHSSTSSSVYERFPFERIRDPVPIGSHHFLSTSQPFVRNTSLLHAMDLPGLTHTYDSSSSPVLFTSQQRMGGTLSNHSDIGGSLTTSNGSGCRSAIITNTSVEILVPETAISFVYGESGRNLARIRQISGAKVVVNEPRAGTSDRIVTISGTPDETQAAQSLLHAFILTGPS